MRYLLLFIPLLSGCVSTETVVIKNNYLIPDKVQSPTKPNLEALDDSKSLCSTENFRKLQVNILLLNQYIKSLNDVISYYEKSIDDFNTIKENSISE